MINALASMIDEISYWDEAGLAEVIPKTSGHNRFVTEIKSFSESFLRYSCKLFPGFKISDDLFFKFFALKVNMSGFLDEGAIEACQFLNWPIYCSLWLWQRLKILFPFAFLRKDAVVHHKHAKYIELGILWGFVVE